LGERRRKIVLASKVSRRGRWAQGYLPAATASRRYIMSAVEAPAGPPPNRLDRPSQLHFSGFRSRHRGNTAAALTIWQGRRGRCRYYRHAPIVGCLGRWWRGAGGSQTRQAGIAPFYFCRDGVQPDCPPRFGGPQKIGGARGLRSLGCWPYIPFAWGLLTWTNTGRGRRMHRGGFTPWRTPIVWADRYFLRRQLDGWAKGLESFSVRLAPRGKPASIGLRWFISRGPDGIESVIGRSQPNPRQLESQRAGRRAGNFPPEEKTLRRSTALAQRVCEWPSKQGHPSDRLAELGSPNIASDGAVTR